MGRSIEFSSHPPTHTISEDLMDKYDQSKL